MILHLVQREMRQKDRHTHRQSDYYRHSNWSDALTNQKGPQTVATTQSWVEADTEPLQGLRARAIIAMSGFLTNSLHVFNRNHVCSWAIQLLRHWTEYKARIFVFFSLQRALFLPHFYLTGSFFLILNFWEYYVITQFALLPFFLP